MTEHDVRLLRTLARARWMTRRQLLALTGPDPPAAVAADETRWRIGRFLKVEFMLATRALDGADTLTLTRRGLAALKLFDPEFAAAVRGRKVRPPNPRSPLRRPTLALNDVWLAFRQSGCLGVTGAFLKNDPLSCQTPDPDTAIGALMVVSRTATACT